MSSNGLRRVAVTGLGIVSPIGSNTAEVTESLRTGKSGIVHSGVYEEMGFRSHVHGAPNVDLDEYLSLIHI